jgi:formimidoylglutamate deiminase
MRQNYFFECALLAGGWRRDVRVEVDAGRIERVSENAAPEPGDQREALVVPGLPNLHSHAFQRAIAGLTERRGPSGADDFWAWRTTMYGFLKQLEADDIEAIAAYAYIDMLEAGFTSVAEFHYLHRTPQGTLYENPAELALRHLAAAETTGIGLTMLPVFYEASNFGGVPPSSGQARFVTDLETFADIVERVRARASIGPGQNVGVGLHSLRAVTVPHLAQLLRHHPKARIHIHAAEQIREVNDCVAFTGLRPVEWLLQNTQMDDRWCVVHATHVNAAETLGLARSGAVVGLCPITEANLGDGIFPGIAYHNAAGSWGIGTDSNVALDAVGELRQLEYSQRLATQARNSFASEHQPSTGRALYEAALCGGAQALGHAVGAITPGHRADFLVLDESHPDLVGRSGDYLLDTWIFTGSRSFIRRVIAQGQTIVEGGRHRDRERIAAKYVRLMSRLMNTRPI